MYGFIKKESELKIEDAIYDEVVDAGCGWMHELLPGQSFRILDMEGNQAVDTTFYDMTNPEDHYGAVTTIVMQGNIYLTTGSILRAESGKPLLEITADLTGRHDTLGGACSSQSNTVRYARENKIPFLGICLGMQCAVIEFARNVLGYKDAHSVEMSASTTHPVIDIMEEQKLIQNMGGTMRLGAYPCKLKENTKIYSAYQKENISERHRHRYEFNNAYLEAFEQAGMIASGINPDTNLVEVVEIPSHPYFVGVQYHPEYRSTVVEPSPLFISFVKAASRKE